MKMTQSSTPTIVLGMVTSAALALLALWVPSALAKEKPARPKLEVLLSQQLEDMEGKEITVTHLEYPPGTGAPRHRHPGHTVVYVVSGELESETDDGGVQKYGPGDVIYESPMSLHATFRNPSKTETFNGIAFMVRDSAKPATVLAR